MHRCIHPFYGNAVYVFHRGLFPFDHRRLSMPASVSFMSVNLSLTKGRTRRYIYISCTCNCMSPIHKKVHAFLRTEYSSRFQMYRINSLDVVIEILTMDKELMILRKPYTYDRTTFKNVSILVLSFTTSLLVYQFLLDQG